MLWKSNKEVAPHSDIFQFTGGHSDFAAESAQVQAVPPAFATYLRRRTDSSDDAWSRIRKRRLRTTGMFAASYAGFLLVCHAQGLIGSATLMAVLAALTFAQLMLYALFATGWNRKAREKTLAAPVGFGALAILLATAYLAPAGRIAYTPFAFIAVGQGMFRLTRKSLLLLSVTAIAGYAAVLGLLHWHETPTSPDTPPWLDWLAAAATLPGFALLAGRGRRLRNALHKAGVRIRYIEEHARRDVLIGCYNRRYMVDTLEQARCDADISGQPLCLAVIDLDHFKSINDEIGHLGGDEVLRNFARIAQESIRQQDVFGRYGGEEFLLVLPRTSLLAALNTVERVRERVEGYEWDSTLQRPVTASIGLTQYIPGETVLDLFSRADNAMYLAKRGGRNQVVVEEPCTENPDPAGA